MRQRSIRRENNNYSRENNRLRCHVSFHLDFDTRNPMRMNRIQTKKVFFFVSYCIVAMELGEHMIGKCIQ